MSTRLTTPDLVVLSLFAEKEQHGYELNAELERREVSDWAGVSRPQVYYSLKKLLERRLIEPAEPASVTLGPDRQVYRITEAGRETLREALGREHWATQRVPPPFLTWLALSPHASREATEEITACRAAFLQERIAAEQHHLSIVRSEADPLGQVAELMVLYTISECENELTWLAQARRVLLSE